MHMHVHVLMHTHVHVHKRMPMHVHMHMHMHILPTYPCTSSPMTMYCWSNMMSISSWLVSARVVRVEEGKCNHSTVE